MLINLSRDSEYHTQRNNMFFPHTTCNTTSAIMALKSSNINFSYPNDMQPEDYLTQILESEEAWNLMKIKAPWAIPQGYHPREVHIMLEWGINTLTGKRVDTFRTDVSIKELLFYLLKGKASIVNGNFTKFGHMVCLSGFESSQQELDTITDKDELDTEQIKKIIIDDPYGNFHSAYKDIRGNNISFSYNQLNQLLNNCHDEENKWAHILKDS